VRIAIELDEPQAIELLRTVLRVMESGNRPPKWFEPDARVPVKPPEVQAPTKPRPGKRGAHNSYTFDERQAIGLYAHELGTAAAHRRYGCSTSTAWRFQQMVEKEAPPAAPIESVLEVPEPVTRHVQIRDPDQPLDCSIAPLEAEPPTPFDAGPHGPCQACAPRRGYWVDHQTGELIDCGVCGGSGRRPDPRRPGPRQDVKLEDLEAKP